MNPQLDGEHESGTAALTGVVVGFDGSATSGLALDWAAGAAAAHGVPLTLLQARPDAEGDVVEVGLDGAGAAPLLGPDAAAALQEAAQRAGAAHPGLEVKAVVHPEAPVRALLDASDTADMVVVGSRGLEGFRGLLLGSTTMNVAPHAHCPVVVLYEPDEETEQAKAQARHPDEVVVGYDGSASADAALDFALRHARAAGLGVAVLVVTKGHADGAPAQPATADDEGLDPRVRQLLRQAATAAGAHDSVPVAYLHAVGRPAGVLIQEASGAALGVVGARGRGGLTGMVLGSVGLQMLIHAECPVAVVHAPAGTD